MIKSSMFPRILVKSITNRRTRIAGAAIAVLLGVSLVSAVAAISMDARSKVGRELRAYGANIVLSPKSTELAIGVGALSFGTIRESGYLHERDLAALQSITLTPYILGYVPYLYGIVEIDQQKVVLAGTTFDQVKKVSPWWHLKGNWIHPGDDNSIIVGTNIAKRLGVEIGQNLTVRYGHKSASFTVVGIIETGADEDNQLFVNLGLAQRILHEPDFVSSVQVSALAEKQPISATAAELQKKVPLARVAVVSQLADAESSLVGRIQTLLFLVSALVLLASALTVASTMMTSVMERTKEIGLMKALGASEAQVASVFLAEAAAIGGIGGILGAGVGAAIASVAGRTVFGAAISINPVILPLSLAVALAVTMVASALPVKRAARIDPAVTLRGE